MSKTYREKMQDDINAHKGRVYMIIKITFVVFAILLLLFIVTISISRFTGNDNGDKEAPQFIGPSNNVIIGYVGETPVYKTWVTLADENDKIVKIDNSEVDKNREGEYKVTYYAEDDAGNRSTYILTYIVKSKDYSWDELKLLVADEAESYGISEDMTKTEKVRKIYSYVQSKIKWELGESGIGESNIPNIDRDNWKNDWIEEAVRTLDTRVGDCYSYYSLSKAFFEYFDIANEGIRRSKSKSPNQEGTHFWSVVEVEEGWYYYDGTRLAGEFEDGTRNACLITQKKLDSYLTSDGEDDFYTMDKNIAKVSKTELEG